MATKQIQVGIIGYGLSAKIFHIPFVKAVPEFRLHAIVQRSPKPGDEAGKDHPDVKVYRSTEELLKDDAVDVVIVTTIPESHLEIASLALKAKKHVVVEKPFTPTSKEAFELVEIAKQEGKFLTVYQNRRFDSDFLTLRKLIEEGKLGRVVEFETHFDRHRPEMPAAQSWKATPESYSAVFDLGSHLIDQVVSVYGLPERITGFVGSQRGARNTTGLEDSFTVLLHYPDMVAVAKAAVVSPEQNQLRFWVKGEKGSFKKFHLDPQEDQLKAGLRPGDQGYGEEPEDHAGVLCVVRDGNVISEIVATSEPATYAEFYRRLAAAIMTGDPSKLPVDPSQAAQVIRLIELSRESTREGRTLAV